MLPKQVGKFTPGYKQMCDCEICIHWKQLQCNLNSWRRWLNCNKHRYKCVVFPDDKPLNLSRRYSINEMLCPKQSSSSLPKWKCVLRQCVNCPKYTVPDYESSSITIAP